MTFQFRLNAETNIVIYCRK